MPSTSEGIADAGAAANTGTMDCWACASTKGVTSRPQERLGLSAAPSTSNTYAPSRSTYNGRSSAGISSFDFAFDFSAIRETEHLDQRGLPGGHFQSRTSVEYLPTPTPQRRQHSAEGARTRIGARPRKPESRKAKSRSSLTRRRG